MNGREEMPMGKMRITVTVKAPPEKVYEVAQSIEQYPSFMSSLKKIELLQKSDTGDYVKARWHAETKLIFTRRKMCWVQDDFWDEGAMSCSSKVDPCECGNYKRLESKWIFKPHAKGTEMCLDLDFELAHPLMTPTIHKVIDGIMERNNRELLESIKKRAESV